MRDTEVFHGIPVEALHYLRVLAANNNTAWFAEHKGTYEEEVRGPLRRLIEALSPAMSALDPGLDLDSGRAVSRIRRDTRFSRDKSPFRTTQWIVFKRRSTEWTSRPAFFMECGPDSCRCGMGFYSAGTQVMAEVRRLAQEAPEDYAAALKRALRGGLALAGESYKRPRVPLDQSECVQELYRRKSVALLRDLAEPDVFGNVRLADSLLKVFAAAAPLYLFWLRAADAATRTQAEAVPR